MSKTLDDCRNHIMGEYFCERGGYDTLVKMVEDGIEEFDCDSELTPWEPVEDWTPEALLEQVEHSASALYEFLWGFPYEG